MDLQADPPRLGQAAYALYDATPVKPAESMGHDMRAVGDPAVFFFCVRCGAHVRASGGFVRLLARQCAPGPNPNKGGRSNVIRFLRGDLRLSYGKDSDAVYPASEVRVMRRGDVEACTALGVGVSVLPSREPICVDAGPSAPC